MARSYEYFKKEIKEYIKERFNKNCTILDVGAGEGTYYNLLGDFYKNIDAIEVYKPNIKKYELEKKYREVYNINIKDAKYPKYDVIIFGDIIEHLTSKEAYTVLKTAYNNAEELIVAVPYKCKQGIVDKNKYEIHIQDDLTPELMLKRYPMLKLLYKNDIYGYYIKNEEWDG